MHVNVRLDEERLYLLVLIGVHADDRKELITLADGYLESEGSWADREATIVLVELVRRYSNRIDLRERFHQARRQIQQEQDAPSGTTSVSGRPGNDRHSGPPVNNPSQRAATHRPMQQRKPMSSAACKVSPGAQR